MFYRVWNNKIKNWVAQDIYLTPYGELVTTEKSFFGRVKLKSVNPDDYILHRSTDMFDRYDTLIFEGDIVEVKFPNEEGKFEEVEEKTYMMVAHNPDSASFILLDYKNLKFYDLKILDNPERCEYLEVIGNVKNNPELIKSDWTKMGDNNGETN